MRNNIRSARQATQSHLIGVKVQYSTLSSGEWQEGEYRGYVFDKRSGRIQLKIKPQQGYAIQRPIETVRSIEKSEEWAEAMALLREFQEMEQMILKRFRLTTRMRQDQDELNRTKASRLKYLSSGRRAYLRKILAIG